MTRARISTAAPAKRIVLVVGLSEDGFRAGETHHNSTISDSTVELIRELHERGGVGYRTLARELNLSPGTVSKICTYERRATRVVRWKTLVPESMKDWWAARAKKANVHVS